MYRTFCLYGPRSVLVMLQSIKTCQALCLELSTQDTEEPAT